MELSEWSKDDPWFKDRPEAQALYLVIDTEGSWGFNAFSFSKWSPSDTTILQFDLSNRSRAEGPSWDEAGHRPGGTQVSIPGTLLL